MDIKKLAILSTLPLMHLCAEEPEQVSSSTDLIGNYQLQDGCGFTVSGSAIYWKANEGGVDYVIQNNGTSGVNNNAAVKRASFDWNWGWKAELDYQVPQNKMSLGASWTHYITDGSSTKSVELPETLFSVWSLPTGGGIPPVAFEQNATAHSRLCLNTIALGMGTAFAPRPFLEITPFIALSSAWIKQKFDFNLSGGPGLSGHTTVDDAITMKNNFWGIGPKIGMNTLWDLGYGIGIAGNFNLSLLYGFFKISQEEVTTFSGLTPPTTYLDVNHNMFHLARLNFDFLLGLRWDKMWCKDRLHSMIEAGWENLIFLGQNQLMRFPSQVNHGINTSSNNDLTIQGLSLRASLSF